MSMITKFYDEYLLKEGGNNTAEREALTEKIANAAEDEKDILEIEAAITVSEDKACEAAFTAGFKTAIQLIMEVIA